MQESKVKAFRVCPAVGWVRRCWRLELGLMGSSALNCFMVGPLQTTFGNSLSTLLPSLPPQDMNNLEEGVEFLPAMNSKKMEKRGPKRRVVVAVIVSVFLLVSLVTGLLVWHFKCECDI